MVPISAIFDRFLPYRLLSCSDTILLKETLLPRLEDLKVKVLRFVVKQSFGVQSHKKHVSLVHRELRRRPLLYRGNSALERVPG